MSEMFPVPPLQPRSEHVGQWVVSAHRYGRRPVNISLFRGLPVTISEASFSDPFGPKALTLTLPSVSILEQLGIGDLHWAVVGTNIDVTWDGEIPEGYPYGRWLNSNTVKPQLKWEGYIESFSWGDGLTIQAKGAMHQLDNYLAKPEYITRPMPYEHAITRQFRNKPGLRLLPARVVFPDWWKTTYNPSDFKRSWEIPTGVSKGDKWTALLTRDTGKFSPALTSYIQTMLTSMYTQWGRWTLDLGSGRLPVLMHRKNGAIGDEAVVIDPVMPGVKITASQDHSQSMTTVFGQGQSLTGVSYTGMEVSFYGNETTYSPLASTPQTHPAQDSNPWYEPSIMRREVMMETQQGLDLLQAQAVARNHLSRFADPGITGTITLTSDPMFNGKPILRFLVRAGMTIQIKNIFGSREGLVAHVTDSTFDIDAGTVTLSFDTKFRDALTANEVRLRGRDALSIPRMLIGGQYQPPVPDQLYPWSYKEGSGFIPSNELYDSRKIFESMSREDAQFPWERITKRRTPASRYYRNCYIRIGPADHNNANNNWASQSSSWGAKVAIPIRASQAATIRMIQIAAYHEDGTIFKVPFHVSLYYFGSTNYRSMPIIPAGDPLMSGPFNYGNATSQQHHPFAQNAWEQYNEDGTLLNPDIVNPAVGAGLIRVWGTHSEPAGYWPGSKLSGGLPTGLLVDETQWSYDISGAGDAVFDPYQLEKNVGNPHSGHLYMMIFCERQATEPIYFLGRMYRVEPGGES